MNTILVTGGAGFIGCNFVRLALSQTNFRVVVLDKLTYAGNLCSLESVAQNPRFAFLEGDISDRNCVDTIFRRVGLKSEGASAAPSETSPSPDGAGGAGARKGRP